MGKRINKTKGYDHLIILYIYIYIYVFCVGFCLINMFSTCWLLKAFNCMSDLGKLYLSWHSNIIICIQLLNFSTGSF